MTKEDFEKEFNKISKDSKACVLIRTEIDAEMPTVGCEGDPKEIIWGLTFTLAQVLKRSANEEKVVNMLTKHTCKLLKKIVEEEDED